MHSNCHNTLWTLISCSLRFLILDNTRKYRPIYNFRYNYPFFSEICNFKNLSGVMEMILWLAQWLLQYLVEPKKVLLEVCHTRKNEKKWPKKLFIGKIAFFWKIVFIDLVGHKEKILLLAQKLWHYLLNPYNMFLEVFLVKYLEKKSA